MSKSSYRAILRSSSIIGGAQVINILTSLLKMKAVAVLLGPTGVGLVGLYMNLVQTAASVASLGIGTAGTRKIAATHAQGDVIRLGHIRRSLFWGTMVLSIVGGGLFWLCRDALALHMLGDANLANDVAWLSLGVTLSVAAGSQSALLTGIRHVGDLALISVGTGVLGTMLSLLALWLWGSQAIITMVLVAPAVGLVLGHMYVSRIGVPAGKRRSWLEMTQECHVMVRLGAAFMFSGLVTLLGQLLVRAMVQRELGSDASGQFQAAWAIGMMYLGFVLSAMGTDYYPRLAAVIHDRAAATQLVNEQTEVALLLCAPVLILMLGFAPWVIRLLYTDEFSPAVGVLRWQLLGDVLKVISWPLGYVLLAAGVGKTFLVAETLGMSVFMLSVWLALPYMGVSATGLAFLAMYAAYLPIAWWLAKRRIGFSWTRTVWVQACVILLMAVVIDLISRWSEIAGAGLSVLLATCMGFWALICISDFTGPISGLKQIAMYGEKLKKWVGHKI